MQHNHLEHLEVFVREHTHKRNAKAFEVVDLMKSWFKDWLEEGITSMADIDPFSRLVQFSLCSLENGSDGFFFYCINFESFKLTIDLKLLIVVVLISILILFFHIWYIIIISERKVYFGYEICQLGLGLMDIRDGAGMGLLILLLTRMRTNQLAPKRVCAGDGK